MEKGTYQVIPGEALVGFGKILQSWELGGMPEEGASVWVGPWLMTCVPDQLRAWPEDDGCRVGKKGTC